MYKIRPSKEVKTASFEGRFVLLGPFFVQIAIALLFCNRPFYARRYAKPLCRGNRMLLHKSPEIRHTRANRKSLIFSVNAFVVGSSIGKCYRNVYPCKRGRSAPCYAEARLCEQLKSIRYNNFRKLKRGKRRHGLQISGRMKSRHTILKGDSKPCPRRLYSLTRK